MKVRGLILRCNVVLISFACFFFLATSFAKAQSVSVSVSPTSLSFGIPTINLAGTVIVAELPSPSSATLQIYEVTDLQSAGSCAQGGGTVTGLCQSNGTAWLYFTPNAGASQSVTVSGSAAFSVSSVSVTPIYPETGNDFTASYTCPTASTSCSIAVSFSDSSAPASTLESATLTITTNGTPSSLTVPLTGAYGAIKLWSSTTVLPSVNTASFGDLYTIASANLNLSCPASAKPVAILSNMPDGSGNVMVDNYITLAINNVPVNTYLGALNPYGGSNYSALYPNQAPEGGTLAYPPGNICQNSDAYPDTDSSGNTYPECFSAAYRADVSNLIGINTDSITNANNIIPAVNGNTAGGVSALGSYGGTPYSYDLGTNFFAAGSLQATFQALDAGYDYETSTMFLVTNCSQAGITPGGTVTGTTITPTTPVSVGVFDGAVNQNMSITINNTGATSPATNATPKFGNYGISQTQFQTLVQGTSAAPTACLLISGELVNGQTVCKGFQVQCYDANTSDPNFGTISGDNCGASTARNLFDSVQFSSPDTPLPATVANTLITSCQSFVAATTSPSVTNGTCVPSNAPSLSPAMLIGPGFLLFGDNVVSSCTYNAETCPYGYQVKTTPGCMLTGRLLNNMCPLNTITSYVGAADGNPGGSTVPSRNSVYIVAMNMPLPRTWYCSSWTTPCSSTFSTPSTVNGNGWANLTNVTLNFQSNAATYNPPTGGNYPSANKWQAAAPYGMIYLIQAASQPLPDPAIPPSVTTGATATFNPASGVNPNYSAAPICPAGLATTAFPTTATYSASDGGFYNAIYFTTACDYSTELYYNPSSSQLTNPTANWASLPVLPFGVDTDPPQVNCSVISPSGVKVNGTTWYGGTVTLSCTASDPANPTNPTIGPSGIWQINDINYTLQTLQPLSASNTGYGGFVSTIQQGQSSITYPVTLAGTPGQVTQQTTTQNATDAAGNNAPTFTQTYLIDMQAPSITGPAFTLGGKPVSSPFTAGQGTITITYSCSDGTGSGVNSCTDAASSLPSGTTSPSCTTTSGVVTCTSTFTPTASNVGSYRVVVNSADYVGNMAQSSQPFSIGYAPATVTMGALAVPLAAVPGKPLAILVGAANTSPASNPVSVYGANIAVQLQMPSTVLGGSVTAAYSDITCTTLPCMVTPKGGAACSVGTGTVNGTTTVSISCPVGTIGDFYTNKTGVVVNINLPISSKAPTSSIKGIANITAATPLSGNTSFSGSVPVL